MKTIKAYHPKVIGLFFLITLFTGLYSFLDNSHFQGMNAIQDKIKERIVINKINKNTLESFKSEREEIKDNIREVVKNDEIKLETQSFFQTCFDRLYFSTITSCLLGYGDIYPVTNVSKSLSSIQSLLTLCMILY
jgi:hypothetical protein